MNNNPYQVRGPRIPQMLGRERLFEDLCRPLIRPTPGNVCVVGPPLSGKSVLLNHLASYFKDKSDYYVTTLYWNLGRHTPETDDEFRRRFTEKIKNTLQSVQADLADCLGEDGNLDDVFEYMGIERLRFLAVLDGFDDVVEKSGITKYLWDDMLTLGEKDSFHLVIGSRKIPSELCETKDSPTWHFWGLLPETLKIGCFEDQDWSGFLNPLKSRGIEYDDSARKEIINWTGGVPVLAAALAKQIFDKFSNATISNSHVNRIAEELAKEQREPLEFSWKACPDLHTYLVELARRKEVSSFEVPEKRRDDLKLRGFAHEPRKNRLRSSCRLMDRYAQQQAVEVNNLQQLFGDAERFESNIQSLLELRLTQIRGADPRLIERIKRAIELLQNDLIESIKLARSIEDRALELIWDDELGPARSLPKDWESKGICFDEQDQFPEDRWEQIKILRRIVEKRVTKVTRPTQLLVDHLHWVGNFGHHSGRSTVSVPIAAAFCISAISLCESLTRDLANTSTEGEG